LAWNALWTRFESASLDERVALVHGEIDAQTLDSEGAWELCNELADPLVRGGRLAELEALFARIERECPEVWKDNAGYFTRQLAMGKVQTGAPGQLEAVLRLGEHFVKVIDSAQHLVDYLRFHGRSDLLEPLLAAAWPSVRDSDNVMDWGKESLLGLLVEMVIDRHRAAKPSLAADDPALLDDLEPLFDEHGRQKLVELVGPWVTRAARTWTGVDFQQSANLNGLLLHFTAALESRWGFHGLRAGLVRESLARWVARPREPKPDDRRGSRSRSAASALLAVTPRSVRELVDEHSHGIAFESHTLAAALLALPHWTEFLSEQGLVERSAAEGAFRTFRGQARVELADVLVRRLEAEDPIAAAAVRAAFSE